MHEPPRVPANEVVFDALLRQRVHEALNDPRPPIPAEDVFARLRAYHAERTLGAGQGSGADDRTEP